VRKISLYNDKASARCDAYRDAFVAFGIHICGGILKLCVLFYFVLFCSGTSCVYYYNYSLLLLSCSSDALCAVVLTFQSVSVGRSSIVLNGFLEFSLLSFFFFYFLVYQS
jgi:hypothetical protein